MLPDMGVRGGRALGSAAGRPGAMRRSDSERYAAGARASSRLRSSNGSAASGGCRRSIVPVTRLPLAEQPTCSASSHAAAAFTQRPLVVPFFRLRPVCYGRSNSWGTLCNAAAAHAALCH